MMQLLPWRALVLVGAAIVASGSRTAPSSGAATTATLDDAPSSAFRDATQAALANLAHEAPKATTPAAPAPAKMVLAAEVALQKKDAALSQTLAEMNRTETQGGVLVEAVTTLQQTMKKSQEEIEWLEEDKKVLLTTVQNAMRTNQTRVEAEQVKDLSRLERSVQERCALEQEELEARLQHAEARAKEAETARDDAKAVAQSLQEQHSELVKSEASLQSEIEELRKKTSGAEAERSIALDSLRGLLRKNAEYKEKVGKPSRAVEHVIDVAPDTDVRMMGETSAMDAYMSKAYGAPTATRVVPPPIIDEGVTRFRQEVRAAKAKKSHLSSWLDGDVQPVSMNVAPAPDVTSPLDSLSALVAPDENEAADDAAESSSTQELLSRAEEEMGF